MPQAEYSVLGTQSQSYINEAGQVVKGYRVTFRLNAFREVHYLDVPNLSQDTVKRAIEAMLADRKNLSTL